MHLLEKGEDKGIEEKTRRVEKRETFEGRHQVPDKTRRTA